MQFESDVPIWQQLIEEFTRRIVTEQWAPGQKIPSVRDLALEVGVNPNTAQKALVELDRSGLTESERTAGRFVTRNLEQIQAARIQAARKYAHIYSARAKGLTMTLSDAQAVLENIWKEDGNNDNTNK